jgi:hypothetical protein
MANVDALLAVILPVVDLLDGEGIPERHQGDLERNAVPTYTERGEEIRLISARRAERHERDRYFRENSA